MADSEKWYFKTSVLVIAILSFGVLALPLLWFNPRFRLKSKIIISLVTIILTYYSIVLLQYSLKELQTSFQQLFS
ncbi:MAG: hypothetical protein PHN59_07500 [Candidatus Omnitrophica bacterium]|nr:hypothetical protein [Candidatus Omnitrophota bacterium]